MLERNTNAETGDGTMNGLKHPVARCLPYLWSKGISRYCDFAGPETYWLQDTECQQSSQFFRRHYADTHGVIWVRLGTKSRDAERCDLDLFVAEALPTIRAPFALITTDGDASVPATWFRTRSIVSLARLGWCHGTRRITMGRRAPRSPPYPSVSTCTRLGTG